MGMRSKGLLLAGMLVCPLAQGEPLWLTDGVMRIKKVEVDLLGIQSVCKHLGGIAASASRALKQGKPLRTVSSSIGNEWYHPVVDMRTHEEEVILWVYRYGGTDGVETRREIEDLCGWGADGFTELYQALQNTPLTPYIPKDGYVERLCFVWGSRANIYQAYLSRGHERWWLRERTLLDADVSMQLELIDFVIDYHGPTPVGEYVETQCRTRSGIFQ